LWQEMIDVDENGIKLMRAIAFGFALVQIAGRRPVINSEGVVMTEFRREAWAIVDEMMAHVPREPA
jgi:hypothetical protein